MAQLLGALLQPVGPRLGELEARGEPLEHLRLGGVLHLVGEGHPGRAQEDQLAVARVQPGDVEALGRDRLAIGRGQVAIARQHEAQPHRRRLRRLALLVGERPVGPGDAHQGFEQDLAGLGGNRIEGSLGFLRARA
ncbi:MAG: hypothetical protein R3B82_22445 [Sandaracinaceae bacterium]